MSIHSRPRLWGLIMIFKEIQMDIPFINNKSGNNNIEEYERTWKWKRRQFQLMTRCMTSMIERLIPSIKTEDYWKLLIECVKDNPDAGYKNMLGVCVIQIQFDIEGFFEMDDMEKKQYVIEKILHTIDLLLEYGFLELEVIKETCRSIINNHYVNEWYWKKPIKKKSNSVQVKLVHDIYEISIFMVFNPDSDSKEEKLLLKALPDEWDYGKYLGKLEWITDNKAQLVGKDGEVYSCDL